MNNEKEISFGAFDSELMRQEIFIPKGFEATIEGDKIILTRKDSEDERIRKFLIKWIQDNYYNGTTEIPTKTLIAWLEKQGEKKPTDKVEPKFKVGDKVIGIVSDMQYYITDVCYDHYYTESGCIIMFCSQDNFKLVEQKPAWSEEDEKMVANLVDYFKVDDALQYTEKQVVDWLKSLKQRIAP